jgi:GMP reductase
MTTDPFLDFDDILLMPTDVSHMTSRIEPMIYTTGASGRYFLPISAANMANIGTFKVAKILQARKMPTFIIKDTYNINKWRDIFYYAENTHCIVPTFGYNSEHKIDEFLTLFSDQIDRICIDVANGHQYTAIEEANMIVQDLPNNIQLVYGNVANPKVLQHLDPRIQVKIGIGSGSVCTTRLKTGVGVPQASLIMHFRNEDYERYLISDGGCRTPGDIVKAFACGANEVMIGGMLAGHKETGQTFFGSASAASPFRKKNSKGTTEGKIVKVPYRGKLEDTLNDIEGGLRSAMTYLGTNTIEELTEIDTWNIIKVNNTHNNYN